MIRFLITFLLNIGTITEFVNYELSRLRVHTSPSAARRDGHSEESNAALGGAGSSWGVLRFVVEWARIFRHAPVEPGASGTSGDIGKRHGTACPGKRPALVSSLVVAVPLCLAMGTASADTLDRLIERLDRLEQVNRELRKEIEALKARLTEPEEAPSQTAAPASASTASPFVHVDPEIGYEILDPTTSINRKQLLILERRKDGTLAPDTVHVQGAVTAIANYQSSSRDGKFGYLMRHPTATN